MGLSDSKVKKNEMVDSKIMKKDSIIVFCDICEVAQKEGLDTNS